MNMSVLSRNVTSNNPQIEEDYDRDVHHGLTYNTSISDVHRPSTKRHIMPRTHEWYPATTSSHTLNDHNTTCRLGTKLHIQMTESRALLHSRSALYRKNAFMAQALRNFSRATDIWETANNFL